VVSSPIQIGSNDPKRLEDILQEEQTVRRRIAVEELGKRSDDELTRVGHLASE